MQYFTRTIVAGNNLTNPADLFKAITLSGDFANNGREAIGILVEGVRSGGHAAVAVMGVMPYVSANVTSAGGALTVTASGFMTNLAAETNEVGVSHGEKGTNQIAVNCGAVGAGLFSFVNKPWVNADSTGPAI